MSLREYFEMGYVVEIGFSGEFASYGISLGDDFEDLDYVSSFDDEEIEHYSIDEEHRRVEIQLWDEDEM